MNNFNSNMINDLGGRTEKERDRVMMYRIMKALEKIALSLDQINQNLKR